ncbi:MAG: glycosyltransferase family 4 protein [Candidatus Cyclobacteriaceae bacterium M2_1C_046]
MVDRYDHTILITTDTVGGVWSFAINLAEALKDSHSQIILAALGPLPSEVQQKQAEDLEHVRLEAFEGKLEWMNDPWESIEGTAEWLRSLAMKYRPDVVHCNHYAHTHLDYGAPVVLTMHSCVKTWWQAVKNEEAPENWSRYGELVQKAIYSADKVVAPTQAILDDFRKQYQGLDDAQVVYNGINLEEYQISEKEPFIFSMGRLWDEAKNIQLLVEAARNIDFPIYIAGKSPGYENLPSNVNFLGWQSKEEIKKYLSKASIYILPVKYEPFGLSFLEAAASSCALIAGKTATLKEVWKDAAIYMPHDEVEELATLANVLMKDKLLLNEMSRRSRKRAQIYDLQKTARSYYQLYKSLNKTLATYEY